jgi:predicted DNA-binding transcriptional regulator AlpA
MSQDPRGKRLLRSNEVCARYGGITTMTLWRWVHSADLEFPQPIYIGRRQFYDADELDAFDRRQLLKSIAERAQGPAASPPGGHRAAGDHRIANQQEGRSPRHRRRP